MLTASAAPGAARTYEAALQTIAPRIVEKSGTPALPVAGESAFFACLDSGVMFGPKSPAPAAG